MSNGMVALACLIIGIAIGASANAALRTASAQTSNAFGPWHLGVDSGGQTSAAWRLNELTGQMEVCGAAGGNPKCFKMPPPGN
jgi:hypothetical protein